MAPPDPLKGRIQYTAFAFRCVCTFSILALVLALASFPILLPVIHLDAIVGVFTNNQARATIIDQLLTAFFAAR